MGIPRLDEEIATPACGLVRNDNYLNDIAAMQTLLFFTGDCHGRKRPRNDTIHYFSSQGLIWLTFS